MELDVDNFQVALDRLKSITENNNENAADNDNSADSSSMQRVVSQFKNKKLLTANRNLQDLLAKTPKSDQDAQAGDQQRRLRLRLKNTLNQMNAELNVGKSVLVNRYAEKLGFKRSTSSASFSLTASSRLLNSGYDDKMPPNHLSHYGRNLTFVSTTRSQKYMNEAVAAKNRSSAPPDFTKRLNAELYLLEKQLSSRNMKDAADVAAADTPAGPLLPLLPTPSTHVLPDIKQQQQLQPQQQPFVVDTFIRTPVDDEYFTSRLENANLNNLPPINESDYSRSTPVTDNGSNNSTITTTLTALNNTVVSSNSNLAATAATLRKNRQPNRLKRRENNSLPLKRFRKAARLIILVLKAISSIKKDSNTIMENEADKYEKVDMYGMIFDMNNFRKPKEIGLTEEAKRILKMPVEKRTDEQIKIAVSSLLEAVPEYNDFPIYMQKSIARVSVLQEFEAGRVIIRQDHKADNFYFIVSGMTAVSVSEQSVLTGDASSKIVAYLSKGRSFGELAIIHAAKRNATVTCSTNVSILCIEREDFIDIFMHYEKGREPEHITFLREIDILNGWPIDRLPYNDHRVCCINYFRKGIMICKDSNKNDWIYFIKQGTCRILKDIPLNKQSISSISRSIEVASKQLEFEMKSARGGGGSGNGNGNGGGNNSKSSPLKNYYNKMLKNKSVYTEVLQIGAKDAFGLVDVLFGNIEGATSVSLVSDGAECIMINKQFFSKHLPDELRKHLRETVAPYPTDKEIQKKFLNNIHWQTFKKTTITTIYEKMNINTNTNANINAL